jgi:predicted GIY-YIG superfamily endonuclease
MVRCADDSFYVGVTSELDRRIAEHDLGTLPKAYTHSRRPVSLVYAQDFSNPDEAIAAEKQIKGWSRAKKTALIAGDWHEVRRLAASRRSNDGQ